MKRILSLLFRLIPAIILAQTLFFKFTGAEESIYIFSTLGVEPWGRYMTGIFELIAVLFFLRSETALLGAVLSLGLMGGAVLSHLFVLGISVQGDGGLLFGLALAVMATSIAYIYVNREEILEITKEFKRK